MTLLVLRPDASIPTAIPEGEVPVMPPGTIVVLPSSLWSMDEDLDPLIALASRHPWVPAVIVADTPALPHGLGSEAVYLLGSCCDVQRVVPPPPPGSHLSSSELGRLIREVIRLRAVPDGGAIARHLCRCVPESVRSDVMRALTGAEGADRALSRRLVRRGLPPARDWRVGAHALRAVAHGIRDGRSEGAAAAAVGFQVKALSSACGRHFGAPWRTLLAIGVWEGVAELFLRTHQGAAAGRVRTMGG